MQETYDIYFSGQIMKDADPAEARRKVGALFKLDGAKLERLFSGEPVAIKRSVDMDRAVKYRLAFREAGALVDILPSGSSPQVAAPPKATPQTAESTPAPATPQPIQADESGLSLSPPQGFDLTDCTQTPEPAPLPDISNLGLDQPGATLDRHEPPPPLQIDTQSLQLAEVGPLPETPETPAASIDTSELTLSAPAEGSLEGYQQPRPPAPVPETDHLSLEEPLNREEPNKATEGRASFSLPEE
jgi:hypothetical protein